jgi:hypothetical protein
MVQTGLSQGDKSRSSRGLVIDQNQGLTGCKKRCVHRVRRLIDQVIGGVAMAFLKG